MENLELTPVELMSVLNWKKSKVYYWINTGKFQTVERMGITKVVISQKDLDSLKKYENVMPSGKSENFSENFEISEEFQNNSNQNVTKHYENIQNSFYQEQLEFFKSTLETIKQIHITATQNYDNSLKMLTDSQSNLEQENFRLIAECKTVQEKLKQTEAEKIEQFEKFKKIQLIKNISLTVLTVLLLFSLVGFIFVSKNSEQNITETDTKKMPAEINQPAK